MVSLQWRTMRFCWLAVEPCIWIKSKMLVSLQWRTIQWEIGSVNWQWNQTFKSWNMKSEYSLWNGFTWLVWRRTTGCCWGTNAWLIRGWSWCEEMIADVQDNVQLVGCWWMVYNHWRKKKRKKELLCIETLLRWYQFNVNESHALFVF